MIETTLKLSEEWEVKLEKLYDLGLRRLKRARKCFYKKTASITNEWDARFYRILENERRKANPWNKKLNSLVSCWNIWHHQLIGHPSTIIKSIYKKHDDWPSRFQYMLRRFNQEHKYYGWDRKFDTLRRIWTDTGKQIKGGIGTMDTDLPNERVKINDLRELLLKQDYSCALTGRPLIPSNCSLDHIIPLSRGGTHTKENAQLVCEEVNRAKGMLKEDEFVALCKDVVAHCNNKI